MQRIHHDFETQGTRDQKMKTEVSVTPQKDLCPPKILKKTYEFRYSLNSSVSQRQLFNLV